MNTRFDKLVRDGLIEEQPITPFVDFDTTYTVSQRDLRYVA